MPCAFGRVAVVGAGVVVIAGRGELVMPCAFERVAVAGAGVLVIAGRGDSVPVLVVAKGVLAAATAAAVVELVTRRQSGFPVVFDSST